MQVQPGKTGKGRRGSASPFCIGRKNRKVVKGTIVVCGELGMDTHQYHSLILPTPLACSFLWSYPALNLYLHLFCFSTLVFVRFACILISHFCQMLGKILTKNEKLGNIKYYIFQTFFSSKVGIHLFEK